ncbi:peptidylprolyl isomerase [Nocardia uniformis]|uniref:Peptidyl-prolyl cis-trans isomerase n=1 Tax=Nocardia uniformis TaxID=53432 RepID=A0A849BR38_9NOCA|nr:peptidylprolyl isomerase [Nocardia uniformis]NNH69152.1 peptidylprolyl isomerase [Nocardia uniformis]
MLIAANEVVSIDYTLTNDAGEVLDESAPGDPLVYLHGAGNIIPGLENALEGKAAGDQLSVVVEPEDGYGEYLPELLTTVSREVIQGVDDLTVGMQLQAEAPDGDVQIITVAGVDGDEVTIDANHELAGQRLTFAIKVVDIRDASAEELVHGHPHEDGDHQH